MTVTSITVVAFVVSGLHMKWQDLSTEMMCDVIACVVDMAHGPYRLPLSGKGEVNKHQETEVRSKNSGFRRQFPYAK